MAPHTTLIAQLQASPQVTNSLSTLDGSSTQLAQSPATIGQQTMTMVAPQQVPLPPTIQSKVDLKMDSTPTQNVIPTQSVTPMEIQENGIADGKST